MGHTETLDQTQGAQHSRARWEARAGQPDRRLKGSGPGQTTVLLMGVPEQSHRARDADGIGPGCGVSPGQWLAGWAEQIVGSAALGGYLTSIQHFQASVPGLPVEQEAATAEAGALGFDHRQHRLGRDQGIDGAATLVQNIQRRFTGQGIGGDHHSRSSGA